MTTPQASRRQGEGLLTVPGDKSIAHRALIFAALARGTSQLRNVPAGLDVRSTQRALRALGVAMTRRDGDGGQGDTIVVTGSAGALVAPDGAIDCGNSGTTIRLLAGVLATRALDVTLDGDASLRARPMRRISGPLERFGARFELAPGGTAPIVVHGNGDAGGADVEIVVPSAQVKSAVLLAALAAHGRTRVTGMLDTRDHTERLFETFGVRCERNRDAIVLDGPQIPLAADFDVPGDMSSAAFLLAAAAAVPGAAATVDGVGLNPTRTAFLDVLRRFGAEVDVIPAAAARSRAGASPSGRASGRDRDRAARGPRLDRRAAAGRRARRVRARNDRRARRGRAPRERVRPHRDVRARGAQHRHRRRDVRRRLRGARPGAVSRRQRPTAGDHRIAMAFAVAGRAAGVAVQLDDPDCMAVSFPGFAGALAA